MDQQFEERAGERHGYFQGSGTAAGARVRIGWKWKAAQGSNSVESGGIICYISGTG